MNLRTREVIAAFTGLPFDTVPATALEPISEVVVSTATASADTRTLAVTFARVWCELLKTS
jgi:hypothetical protein